MSDPVTNIEIEDVLASIRKLVSEGDKSRTRDPAPDDTGSHDTSDSQPEARPAKLVLTPAFLVPDSVANTPQDHVDNTQPDDAALRDMVWEAVDDVPATTPEPDLTQQIDDGALNESDSAGSSDRDEAGSSDRDEAGSSDRDEAAQYKTLHDAVASDRSRLEASIAELEAAFSGDAHDYEPDGSEYEAEPFYWPGSMVRPLHEIEDAETQDAVASETQSGGAASQTDHAQSVVAEQTDAARAEDEDAGAPHGHTEQTEADVYADDDLEDLFSSHTGTIDDEALRKLISEIVREELMGTLGERITRNVRKLVRREIYRILSSQDFD